MTSFYTLAKEYEKKNLDQAYLCYENAIFHKELPEQQLRMKMKKLIKMGKVTVSRTAIVILSYNSIQMMQQCIESIRKHHLPEMYELVVVDNASTDGVAEWLAEQDDIKLILNKENMGFPAGCNQGIRIADSDSDILLLNNDTLVPPDALFWLRMAIYESEQTGAAGSVTNYAPNYQNVEKLDLKPKDYLEYASLIQQWIPHPYEKKSWLVGYAMLLKREALERVGMLDEQFSPGNYEDNDYGIRMGNAGYQQVLCHNSFIYHYGGHSFGKNQERLKQILSTNEEKFIQKWNISSSRYHYIKHELIQKITEPSERDFSILEIGCGCGATLARLTYQYPAAKLYGIEKHAVAAKIASTVAEVQCQDIEREILRGQAAENQREELPTWEMKYDYILMGGVLECLNHPEKTLEQIGELLSVKGKLIVSCYNKQHISCLNHGRKQEKQIIDYGPLDEKHVQHYDIAELLNLMERCGYEVVDISYEIKRAEAEEQSALGDILRDKAQEEKIFYEIWKYVLTLQKQ